MLGSIISGIGSALGGLFGMSGARDANAAAERMAERNIEMQREFAQQGVRWRVADARAAGISPLAALGASTNSFSNVVGGGFNEMSPIADAARNMGQDIGRAVNATRTQAERTQALASDLGRLTVEGASIDNDIKRTQLASNLQRLRANDNPPMPPGLGPEDVGPWSAQKTAIDKRARLNLGGGEIATDPNVSSMKELEDRYGDEGPVASLLPLWVAWRDYKANYPDIDYPSARARAEEIMSNYWGRPSNWARMTTPDGRLGKSSYRFRERR